MKQRGILALSTAVILLAAACSSDGDGVGISSEAAGSGPEAAADVEGVPEGCDAVLDVAFGPVDFNGNMTEERLDAFEQSAEQAREALQGESAAAGRYLELIGDLSGDLREVSQANPDITPEAALAVALGESNERNTEFDELAIETIAFLDRYCGTDIANPAMFGGPTASQDADGGRPDDEPAENAISMDGADSDQNGEANSDADNNPTTTTVPIAAELAVETDSSGATGTYLGIDIEVGEIWRTNKNPSDALKGTDVGTDQSWVMVEVRLANERGGITLVPGDAIRWLDEQGELIAPVGAFTPQGNEWNLNFPVKSSERRYMVYPATVGATEGASLQVVGQNMVPETIPLGRGTSSSPYPVSISIGQTGTASYLVNACSYDVATDVRAAEIALNGEVRDRWERPADGQRFVVIDLGITLVDRGGPNGCLPTTALFQLESQLELSNGDTVAPADSNFETVDKGATKIDRLVFAIADDVTSMTLKAVGGEVLAQWEDLTIPQP